MSKESWQRFRDHHLSVVLVLAHCTLFVACYCMVQHNAVWQCLVTGDISQLPTGLRDDVGRVQVGNGSSLFHPQQKIVGLLPAAAGQNAMKNSQ